MCHDFFRRDRRHLIRSPACVYAHDTIPRTTRFGVQSVIHIILLRRKDCIKVLVIIARGGKGVKHPAYSDVTRRTSAMEVTFWAARIKPSSRMVIMPFDRRTIFQRMIA